VVIAEVRVAYRVEAVQRVVVVAGVDAVDVARPEAGEAAIGKVAVAQGAERGLLGRELAAAVVVVDRRAGGVTHGFALTVCGVGELDRWLGQRWVGHPVTEPVHGIVTKGGDAAVEILSAGEVPGGIVAEQLLLAERQRPGQPAAGVIVGVTGGVTVRVGLGELVAELIVIEASRLAGEVDDVAQPAEDVVAVALGAITRIGLADPSA
jgi:hypothetical protein